MKSFALPFVPRVDLCIKSIIQIKEAIPEDAAIQFAATRMYIVHYLGIFS